MDNTPADDEALVWIDEGVSVSKDLYEVLTDIRGEDIRRKADGQPLISLNEKARRLGVDQDTARFLLERLARQDRRLKEGVKQYGRKPKTLLDRASSLPFLTNHRKQGTAHSDFGSPVDWESVPGYRNDRDYCRQLALELAPAAG